MPDAPPDSTDPVDADGESRELKRVGGQPRDPLESAVAIEMIENMPSYLARGTVYIMILAVLTAFLYSYFGKMDVVVQGHGKLIPEGDAEVVQAATNGIVRSILVKEGDVVKKGDVLAELDIVRSTVEEKKRKVQLEQLQEKIAGLELAIDITTAVLRGENVQIDEAAIRKISSAEYVAAILSLKQARIAYDKAIMQARDLYPTSLQSLASAVEHKTLNLKTKQNAVQAAKKDLERTRAQYDLYKSMFEKGLCSKVKLLEEEKRFDEAASKLDESRVNLDQAISELATAKFRLDTTTKTYAVNTSEAEQRYKMAVMKHNASLKSMKESLKKQKIGLANFHLETQVVEQQLGYNRLIAPVDGTITSVKLQTPGEAVRIGTTLFTLNPSDRPLVAKIKIPNRSIGRILTGMKVKLKLDAYPYQKYGVLTGRVLSIAPDSHIEGKNSFYSAVVKLDKTFVERKAKRYDLFTGLTLKAEIVVERQRIIESFVAAVRK